MKRHSGWPTKEARQAYDKAYYAEHRDQKLARDRSRRAVLTPEQREKVNAQMRAWRKKNPERWKELKHRDYETHKEKRLQANMEWRHRNPEREYARSRKWLAAHPEWRKAYHMGWRQRNSEKVKAIWDRYSATEKGKANSRAKDLCRRSRGDYISPSTVREIMKRPKVCGICGKRIRGDYHIDHIVPLAQGGRSVESNLQLAHPKCNLSKGSRQAA